MGLASRINIATAVVVALMLPCSCTASGSPRVGRTHAVDPPAVGGGDDTGTTFRGGMAEFYRDKGLTPEDLSDGTRRQIEAAIAAQDAIARNDYDGARRTIDEIRDAMGGWNGGRWGGGHLEHAIRVGDQGAKRALMNMETIVDRHAGHHQSAEVPSNAPQGGELTVLAIVARCQTVHGREFILNPAIRDDDYGVLREAADIWVRWLGAITGLRPRLQVHEIDACVDSWDGGRAMFPDADQAGMAVPWAIRSRADQFLGVFPAQATTSVMGGQGEFEGQAFLLNDDVAYIDVDGGNGPSGNTAWTSVERRLYFADWLGHEFLHWLAKAYPEYNLEPYLHSWFDSTTWPADFDVGDGSEAQYVREALYKRFFKFDDAYPLVNRVAREDYGGGLGDGEERPYVPQPRMGAPPPASTDEGAMYVPPPPQSDTGAVDRAVSLAFGRSDISRGMFGR